MNKHQPLSYGVINDDRRQLFLATPLREVITKEYLLPLLEPKIQDQK